MARKPKNLKENKKILVYCEGMTEVHYINMLKRKYNGNSVIVTAEKSKKTNPIGIIDSVIKSRQYKDSSSTYVLFDRDSHTKEEILDAITFAKRNGIKVGYSNHSFDLWILMHFVPLNSYIENKELCKRLNSYFSCENYEKDIKNNYHQIEKFLKGLSLVAITNSNKIIGCNVSNQLNLKVDVNPFHNIHEVVDEIFGITNYKNRFD